MPEYDWNKLLFESKCYDIDSDFRSLRHAAGCLAVIPREIRTPALTKLRQFFEKTQIYPRYLLHTDLIQNSYSFRNLVVGGRDSLEKPLEPDEILHRIKWALYYHLNDAVYNIAVDCNQRVIMGKKYDKGTTSAWTNYPSDVKNRPDSTEICKSNFPLLKKAYELAGELQDERWNTKEMVKKMEGFVNRKWIKEHAWDLNQNELKQVDLPKRMGLLEGNYAKW